ncbi:MAG: SWIM zinc finger family protein, partial [Bacteroidia bacterium]|nr:SWIM zinc finger family protein [Bacteroidia bacterium]
MAQVYGRTWWGQQWLKSLDRIDYSNRLPRGKSYANTGKVKSIEIEGHIIRAKVAGSRPKPYDVSIVVPPFTDKEKKALIESIKKDNLILSQLLNRHLPNELLSLAEQNFIKIFPQSWQDLKLNCSCPDWAVPCKHLAAVIYTVATQIDQNPFSVFTLHSLDLIKELAKERLLMEEEGKEKIYTLSEAIEKEKYTTIYPQPEVPDFSIIESLQDSLPILFPASPLFFSNDFKPLIQRFYKYWAKSESQYLTNLKNEKNNLSNNFRYHHFKIIFNNDANVEIWATDEDENKHLITSHDLLTLLAQTESKHLPNYSQSFILLYRTFRFINILIERNALLPRLLKVNDDTYQIQWIPALINESVKNTFSKLMQWYQNDIIVLNNLPSTKTKKETLANHTSLHPEDAMILLSSFFTATSISSLTTQLPNIFTVSKNKLDDKILVLFFQNKTQSFDSFSEKEIPNTIQLWLKRFFIGKKEFSLILQVSELEGEGFEVDVLIRSNNAQLPYTESLYDFMLEKNEMRLGALKDLQLLAYYMPGLNTLISSGGEQKLKYNTQTFSEVLTAILPTVRMLGIQTLLPKSLQNLLRPKVSLSLKGKKGKTFFTLNDMIDYDWKVSVGEQFIDLAEFKKIVSKASGLVKIRNEYVMMTKEDIERIIKKIESSQTPPSLDLLRSALSEDYYGASVHIDEDLKKQIKKLTQVQETSLPNGIKASLRPYQHRGYSWMYKNAKLGIGSLLADDMGLGKTLQVITTLLKFKEDGLLNKQPALVIAPTTLLSNWKSEIQKFAPKLRTEIFHGIKRKSEFKNTDVVITTYGIARTDTAVLNKKKWHV